MRIWHPKTVGWMLIMWWGWEFLCFAWLSNCHVMWVVWGRVRVVMEEYGDINMI